MKSFSCILALVATAAPAFAALATTTRYDDNQEGACGCGGSSGAFSWQYGVSTGVYTAAGSQVLFDTEGGSWCGGGCGKCYKLTNQGYSACSTCGSTAGAGESIIVMVTNLCPNNGNAVWCPVVGGSNQYGYGAHFDIMSKDTALVNGNWDNPVVDYEEVACPGAAAADYGQCICDTGTTPVTLTSSTVKPSTSKTSSKLTTSTKSTVSSSSIHSTTSTTSTSSTVSKATSSSLSLTRVTTKPATTSTSTSAIHVTSSIAASNGTVPLYGQCAGVGWTGGTVCITGTCVYSNDWYSQCLATSGSTQQEASVPANKNDAAVALYDQCGGINWTGGSQCAEGTCRVQNPYYSQCVL